jgi:hypothetical protein
MMRRDVWVRGGFDCRINVESGFGFRMGMGTRLRLRLRLPASMVIIVRIKETNPAMINIIWEEINDGQRALWMKG